MNEEAPQISVLDPPITQVSGGKTWFSQAIVMTGGKKDRISFGGRAVSVLKDLKERKVPISWIYLDRLIAIHSTTTDGLDEAVDAVKGLVKKESKQ